MADLSITAANVVPNSGATVRYGYAGATITAGQALYKDSADSNALKLADANATAATSVVGIALCGAADGQPMSYVSSGSINLGATLAVGVAYSASTTPGAICPVADHTSGASHYMSVVGVATSTANLLVDIINSGVILA